MRQENQSVFSWCRAWLAFALITSACGCSCVRSVAEAPPKADHGIELVLSLPKDTFKEGEPIIVTAELRNTGREEVLLPEFNPWGRYWPETVSSARPKYASESHVYLSHWPKGWWTTGGPHRGGFDRGLLRIPPGGCVQRSFALADAYDCGVLPPDNYSVQADYKGRTPAFDVDLVSNDVKFHIVPARDGLQIILRPTKKVFTNLERITVTVEFRNGSDQLVSLPPLDPKDPEQHYKMCLDPGAGPPYRSQAVIWALPVIWGEVQPNHMTVFPCPMKDGLTIPPRGSFAVECDLTALPSCTVPAERYSLYMEYKARRKEGDIALVSNILTIAVRGARD